MNQHQKPKAVIFDIDGVLAEKSEERDYREYDKVNLDKPIRESFDYLRTYVYDRSCEIIFITGRKEFCRDKTLKWLKHKMDSLPDEDKVLNSTFYFRADDDHQKAPKLKKEICEKNKIFEKYDVVRIFEDDPEVVKMYMENFNMELEGGMEAMSNLQAGIRQIYILS